MDSSSSFQIVLFGLHYLSFYWISSRPYKQQIELEILMHMQLSVKLINSCEIYIIDGYLIVKMDVE